MSDILLDVDDVLLDWTGGFRDFLIANTSLNPPKEWPHGGTLSEWLGIGAAQVDSLVTRFNSSPFFARLDPCPGALYAIKTFRDLGLDITVITSCGKSVTGARRQNLRDVFGGDMGVFVLELHEPKFGYLAQFDPAIWVEDRFSEALSGDVCGHDAYCFRRPHNTRDWQRGETVTWVDDWSPVIRAARSAAARKHRVQYSCEGAGPFEPPPPLP